jgi:hypothetical protein
LSIAVDKVGNAYITGYAEAGIDQNAFLTKFDPLGNQIWSRNFGTSSSDAAVSLAADAVGNVYITGRTSGSLGGTNAGDSDAFLTKYSALGNLVWSRQFGYANYDATYSVAVDSVGNAYIAGGTNGSPTSILDGLLIKYSPSGERLWLTQIGTPSFDESRAVAVDRDWNVYVTGYTDGDLGGPNAGSGDVFLVKYNAAGGLLWSQQFGTDHVEGGEGIAIDVTGGVYVAGTTRGNLGAPNVGEADAYLVKYDQSGNFLWSHQFGTSKEDFGYSVAIDGTGNVVVSGATRGDLANTNLGDLDAFVVKFVVPEPATMALLCGGLAYLFGYVRFAMRRHWTSGLYRSGQL